MIREIGDSLPIYPATQSVPTRTKAPIAPVPKTDTSQSDQKDLATRTQAEQRAQEAFAGSELRRGRRITFSLEPNADQPIIQVRDSRTGETIRQIPAEELRRLSEVLEEMRGHLFDKTI